MTSNSNKRVLESPAGPSKLDDFEEAVDTKVADTVQQVLARLQSERDRLVQTASDRVGKMTDDEKDACEIELASDPDFDQALENLLAAPFGSLHVSGLKMPRLELLPNINEKEPLPENVVNQTPTPGKQESGDMSLETGSIPDSPKPKGVVYDEALYKRMRVIGVVSGKDLLGATIQNPYGILRLPDSDCLAFIHNENHISLLSADAKIMATFKLKVRYRPTTEFLLRPWDQGGLAADGKNNELFVVDTFCRFCRIRPADASSRDAELVPETCTVSGVSSRSVSGFAISQKARHLYIGLSQEIVGFSLEDWSQRTVFSMKRSEGAPTICACSDTHLYYKFNDEHELYRVPLKENGEISGPGYKFQSGFKKIRGLSFDSADNLLIVDNGRRRIEVLSPQGISLCSIHPESPAKESFYPSGVALLEPSVSSKFRPIVAVTDYYADCVLFFAPSGDM